MNIFNSLGSNYNTQYILNSIYLNTKDGRKKLIKLLEDACSGRATLFYKGRSAITQALLEARLDEESRVAVTGFTCIAVADAIKKAKMKPVFLDIDPETLNFTAKTLEEQIKKNKLHAVIVQNTLGFPCDIEAIQNVCKKHKLILIEDLAHSVGSIYFNKKEAGLMGDFVVFSFSQDKVIDAVSGGALISKNFEALPKSNTRQNKDASFQDKLYPFATHIIRVTYKSGFGKFLHVVLKKTRLLSNPMKSDIFKNMSDWSATLALQEFEKLDDQIEHRQKISNIYKENIKPFNQFKGISNIIKHSTCLRFPVKITNRDGFIAYAKSQGLYVSDIWYDAPIAPKRFLDKSGYIKGECPEAEKISEVMVNLPTHINVSEADAHVISKLVNTWELQHK